MRRTLLYLIVILVTLFILLYVRNPDLLEEIWIWVVGLFAVAAAYIQQLGSVIKSLILSKVKPDKPSSGKYFFDLRGEEQTVKKAPSDSSKDIHISPEISESKSSRAVELETKLLYKEEKIRLLEEKLKAIENKELKEDLFEGTSIYLLRYLDDGETTLGMLFIDSAFFCYTLEGSQNISDSKDTRIPEGDYLLTFDPTLNTITQKYRRKSFAKAWFKWHILLKEVPGHDKVYIYSGGEDSSHIMISKGLKSKGDKKVLTDSKETFEAFYHLIREDLEMNIPVRIRIFNEQWIQKIN